jgi:HlyD family secretion protein
MAEIKTSSTRSMGTVLDKPKATSAPFVDPPKVATTTTVTTIKRKKKTKRNVYLIVALLAALGAVYYFFIRTEPTPPVSYRYSSIERGNITKGVTATGTIQATKTVQVGSQVSGTITELYADFNSRVTKGQILARLDPTFYNAAVAEAQANLAKANAELANNQRDEERGRDLLKTNLIAQAEYDLIKTKLLNSRATVDQVRAQLQRAQVNLGYTIIRSPISGTVVSREVDIGQTVAASLNAPVIFKIAEDLNKMQVAANIDEADIGQVKDGQNVKFTVDAYPGEPFTGTVLQTRINPTVTQNVVTYSVIIDANNDEGKLLPGLTATVNIVADSREDVLRIPNAALRFNPDGTAPGGARSFGAGGGQATAQRSNGQGGGNATGAKSGAGNGAGRAARTSTIYIKSTSKNAEGKSALVPVKVKLGLTDGAYTEILSSEPALKSGDSIATGIVTVASPNATANPSSSPIPMGGPGGGGARRAR